jgi:hypothetical protein
MRCSSSFGSRIFPDTSPARITNASYMRSLQTVCVPPQLLNVAAAHANQPIVVPEVDDILSVLTSPPAPLAPQTRTKEPAVLQMPLSINYLEREVETAHPAMRARSSCRISSEPGSFMQGTMRSRERSSTRRGSAATRRDSTSYRLKKQGESALWR